MNSGSMPSARQLSSLAIVSSRARSVRGLRIFLRISSNASQVCGEIQTGRANDEGVAFGVSFAFVSEDENEDEDEELAFG